MTNHGGGLTGKGSTNTLIGQLRALTPW